MLSKVSILLLAFGLLFPAALFGQSAELVINAQVNQRVSPADAGVNRDRGYQILDQIKNLIKERYYDKTFHGIDLETRFKAAKERIKKLDQNWQIFRVIAQLVLEFDDSHTLFVPPGRHLRVEYGFSIQMIGDQCYVMDVKTGSDAEKKGLKPGDVILQLGKFPPTRQTLWQIEYLLYALDPQQAVDLTVRSPDGSERSMTVASKFSSAEELKKEADQKRKEQKERKEPKEEPFLCQKFDNDAIACKLKSFEVEKYDIDEMMRQVKGSHKFILDLRGNGGGLVAIEEYLTGYFFDHDVKIATMVSRDKPKDHVGRTMKDKAYTGDMIILIDSDSASASEVFARVMQIEKRAKILGDVSSGKVMTSNFIPMAAERGPDIRFTYSVFAMNITVADLIMSDGQRLEKIGVVPDQFAMPTPGAIRDRRDPVLALAAGMLGAKLSVNDASNFHFLLKKPETKVSGGEEKSDGGKQ